MDMASKSKECFLADKRTGAGGKVPLRSISSGSRKSPAACLNSGGESSNSSSDEELRHEHLAKKVAQCQADAMEFCPALGRPDKVTTIRQIPGTSLEDFVVRASETANHVLLMGSPSMLFYPLRCPFKEEQCVSFRAYAPQHIKEHLESKHNLLNVQVNLACPCPAVCNVVNGEPRECHSVQYDPIDGVLESHIQDKLPTYFDNMGYSLCIRKEKEENILDVPEEVKNYVQYLDTGKKLPDWTRKDPLVLFPSQVFPEKIMLPTVVKDKIIQYACPIPPCRGERVLVPHDMSMHLLDEPGHRERMGFGSLIFECCPKCDFNIHWSEHKMLLHVRAVHPEMVGEPNNFTEAAKAELAKLVGQIKGKIIGRAIGDTPKRGDESAGTKTHFLYSFRCHLPNCKQVFSERDHLEWHIKADHRPQWNTTPQ